MEGMKGINEWLWTAILPLLGWAWRTRREDLKQLRAEIATKADKEDLARNESNVDKLFNKQDDLQRNMNIGFAEVTALVHSGQMAIMRELAKKADK